MAKVTLTEIRPKMESKRKKFLKEATGPKEIGFGNDLEVLDFATRNYVYGYNAWHGNYPKMSEISYWDYWTIFTDKYNYDIMMEDLREDYRNSKDVTAKNLISAATTLRRRYGRN